ncbi:MAG: thioesterase family protein [Streptosporangiaceae bacterium]
MSTGGAGVGGTGSRDTGSRDTGSRDTGSAREQAPRVPPGVVVGLRATARAEVTDSDTAAALGSGDVPVLGTPRLLALAEAAAMAAIAPVLAEGQTSVGTAVSLEHKRPSRVGAEIEVEAELSEITGRRLVFVFIAYGEGTGEDAVIGAGSIERVLVDREHFVVTANVAGG